MATKMQAIKSVLAASLLDRPVNGSLAGVPERTGSPPSVLRRYEQEISQMLFVAGEVKDPLPETVHQVEDIVRGQVIELAVRARTIANRRGSRSLAPEDVFFLIRHDRPKVNRLRTFLSWINVRKNTRQTTDNIGAAPTPAGSALTAEGQDSVEEGGGTDQLLTALPATVVRLPWELTSIYSDFLDQHDAALASLQPAAEDDLDLGIEDLPSNSTVEHEQQLRQLYWDNLDRLKTADDVTKGMTKDEYAYYSECRQVSFTFRKAKRFRDFINFSLYLDFKPSDDIIDLLGFLAFEVVHTLALEALRVKAELEPPLPPTPPSPTPPPPPAQAPAPASKVEPAPEPTSKEEEMDIDEDPSVGVVIVDPPSPPPKVESTEAEEEDDPVKGGGLFGRPKTRGRKEPSPSPSLTPPPDSPSALSTSDLSSPPATATRPSTPPPPPSAPPSASNKATTPAKRPASPPPPSSSTSQAKRPRPTPTPSSSSNEPRISLFAPPSTDVPGVEGGQPQRTPLRASHVAEAYVRLQRREGVKGGFGGAGSAGGRGAPGQGRRRDVALI